MRFRDKISKATFKNKKLVGKRDAGEEHISADQRGNHSSGEHNPLSLDTETITPREPRPEQQEISRRSLFSFGRVTEFAEEVAEDEPETQEEEDTQALVEKAQAEETLQASETLEDETVEPEEPVEKKGFFRRLVDKFRPASEEDAAVSEPEAPVVEDAHEDEPVHEEEAEEEPEENPEDDPEYNRRNLLRQGVHFFAKPAIERVSEKIQNVNNAVDKITRRVPLIRPPGAIEEQQFLNACTRCDKCIQACPKDAIVKAPKKMGFFIMGTPYIDPKVNPCVMCDDLYCISACPDAALLPVESKFDVSMGYAILDKKKCQAYGHTFCQQCVIDCPIPGAITQKDERPIIHKDVCTGCGVCLRSCSTVNIPVAIKIKPQMVIDYQIKKKQMEREAAEREAERLAELQKEREEEEALMKESSEEKEAESTP